MNTDAHRWRWINTDNYIGVWVRNGTGWAETERNLERFQQQRHLEIFVKINGNGIWKDFEKLTKGKNLTF